MKVLHAIHSLSGGGAETQLKMLVNTPSDQMSHGVLYLAAGGVDTTEWLNVQAYLGKQGRRFKPLLALDALLAIRKFKPQLVHVWLPVSVTIPVLIAAKLCGLPTVFSFRNEMSFRRFGHVLEFFFVLLLASRIISNTNPARSSFLYRFLYRLKRGAVVRNCTSARIGRSEEIGSRSRQQLNLLYVGRITPQKNWRCLVTAMASVSERSRIRLRVCGDGEEMESLVDLVKTLGLEETVEVLGYRKDIFPLMIESDALIHPALYEGMPNVVLEALSLGLPVVCSDIPAHRELLPDNCATFFDPASPSLLADVIDNLALDWEPLEAKAACGMRHILDFSPEKMVTRYEEAYKNVVGR